MGQSAITTAFFRRGIEASTFDACEVICKITLPSGEEFYGAMAQTGEVDAAIEQRLQIDALRIAVAKLPND